MLKCREVEFSTPKERKKTPGLNTLTITNWCHEMVLEHSWLDFFLKNTNCSAVIQMMIDLTQVERYLFVSEGILQLPLLLHKT